jgi:hypothetical protein
MTAAETFEVVDEIADEWLEMVGDYFVAARVASIMPDPIAWFSRQVSAPELPMELIERTRKEMRDKRLDLPIDCGCDVEWDDEYSRCPRCLQFAEPMTVADVFRRGQATLISNRNDALASLSDKPQTNPFRRKGGNS